MYSAIEGISQHISLHYCESYKKLVWLLFMHFVLSLNAAIVLSIVTETVFNLLITQSVSGEPRRILFSFYTILVSPQNIDSNNK